LTGGAFGIVYQMGALSAAKRKRKSKLTKDCIFYGCSAGALAAAMTLLGYSDEEFFEIFHHSSSVIAENMEQRPFEYSTYNLTIPNFELFRRIDKDYPNAYKTLTKKKLHIGVTMETSGFRWFTKFRSNKELFHILLCSYHLPFACSYNSVLGSSKEKCIDGMFGFDADKHLPPKTLIICPKHMESERFDVLNGEMSLKACITPSPLEERLGYYKQGYNDMRLYMKTGKSSKTTAGKIDEAIVPVNIWWALRKLQPEDTTNVLS